MAWCLVKAQGLKKGLQSVNFKRNGRLGELGVDGRGMFKKIK